MKQILVELQDINAETLAAEAERIQTEVKKTSEWVRTALDQADQINSAHSAVRQREKWVQYAADLEKGIQQCLGHEDPACRRASWFALYKYYFSADLRSGREVTTLLTNMVERGYLVALDGTDGPFKAYGRTYGLPPDSMMGKEEETKVKRSFIDFVSRAWQRMEQRQTELAQDLLGKSEITWSQILADKEGKYACQIPPEQVNGRWLRGGVLLVEAFQNKIFAIRGAGGFASAIEELRNANHYLWVNTLKQDTCPPYIRNLSWRENKNILLLWRLLRQGIAAEAEREKTDAYRNTLTAKATVSPEEFLLYRKPGLCLIEFSGTWEKRTNEGLEGTISNLFFLAERKESDDGADATIRIVEAPPHLQEFLSPCLDGKFLDRGTKFDGCEQPLRAVLMAVYGQVSRTVA